jgi:hypothetical protein
MGLFDSLFKNKPTQTATAPEANDAPTLDPASALLVVFAGPVSYTAEKLQKTLRAMSPTLSKATVEGLEGTAEQGTPLNRINWNEHVIDAVGFSAPVPKHAVENCVQPAHYKQEIKASIRSHLGHAILYYSGPRERYIALSIVAGALSKHGAIGVLNESAMTSLPAETVYQLAVAKPDFAVLRHLQLLMLFCGFVKYFMPDKSAWMRTYNNPAFGLPDFATRAANEQSSNRLELFSSLMDYLLNSKARFALGHTAQFGDVKLKFRAPRDDEPFPTDTKGQLLIVEMVG